MTEYSTRPPRGQPRSPARRSPTFVSAFDTLTGDESLWTVPTDRRISASDKGSESSMSTFSIISAIIMWNCVALILFSYAIYPPLIWALSRWFAGPIVPPACKPEDWPSVSLLIAAYNEEDVIEDRVRNAIEMDYPSDRLES